MEIRKISKNGCRVVELEIDKNGYMDMSLKCDGEYFTCLSVNEEYLRLMADVISEYYMRKEEAKNKPCDHRGCDHYVTHPCEGCERLREISGF